MKLIFLGTGSAFTIGASNFHSNMILEDDHKNQLLIDCGSDARFSLHEQGFSHRHITDVYISHLHADHAGVLPDAEHDGFRGFVRKGQCFDFSDKKSFT